MRMLKLALPAILALLAVAYCVMYHYLSLQVAFADDQVDIIEYIKIKALESDPSQNPSGTVDFLEAIVQYYPSGTKQRSGSKLDRIVENVRKAAVREVIAFLRDKLKIDLGDDPQKWIEHYQAK